MAKIPAERDGTASEERAAKTASPARVAAFRTGLSAESGSAIHRFANARDRSQAFALPQHL
jgi:putative endonuclease